MPQDRTAVYRLFAQDRTLLYVGVAQDVGKRWREHAADKPWWTEVRRQIVDWYDTREEALSVEVDAIRDERPVYNVQHSTTRKHVLPVPVPLTPDERVRLEKLEARPDEDKTRDELLDELRLLTLRRAWDRYCAVKAIRDLLPPAGSGRPVPRGLFTKVVDATPWTREYVARVRDGKVLIYDE